MVYECDDCGREFTLAGRHPALALPRCARCEFKCKLKAGESRTAMGPWGRATAEGGPLPLFDE